MGSGMVPYALVSLFSIFLGAVSQVLLKKEAMKPHDSIIKEYLNPRVVFAYLLFFITTLLGVLAYKGIPVSLGSVFETTGYVWVTLFGVFIFREKLTRKRVLFLCVIIAGVLIYAFG